MSRFKHVIIVFGVMLLLMFFAVFFIYPAFCFSREEAKTRIESAESEVLDCYLAVFGAERAGANVSHLLNVLNEAGWVLSKAKLAYAYEDYGSAVTYANKCHSMLEGFIDQASTLRRDAESAGRWDFMINYVGSAVGAVGVVVGGYGVWIWLNKKYGKVET